MTDHRDEHETYGHTHSPVIEDLRKQVATLLDEQTGFRVAIAQLTAERDEARRECRLLLLGQEVLRGLRDLPAPPDDLVTIVPVPRKEDKP
jgi:hypothetical protein